MSNRINQKIIKLIIYQGAPSMPAPSDELKELIKETRELSNYIAELKRKRNRVNDEIERDQLTEEIKMRQHQALFYIDKMENVNKLVEAKKEK